MSEQPNTEYLPEVCCTCAYCRSKSTEDKQIDYSCELTGRVIPWPTYEICISYERRRNERTD